MGVLESIKNLLRPKKRVPVKARIQYLVGVQNDNYLFSLLDDIKKEKKRLDAETPDEV